jgi:hypothetical protein
MEELLGAIIKFDGARNHDVVEWLQYIEEIFDRHQLQASLKYAVVPYFLTSYAASWFKYIKPNNSDWLTFKREIIAFFSPSYSSSLPCSLDRHHLEIHEVPEGKLEQPLKLERQNSCVEPEQSSVELNIKVESDSFWPEGTESWYIHEIKPQRESLSNRNHEEPLPLSQLVDHLHEPNCFARRSKLNQASLCAPVVSETVVQHDRGLEFQHEVYVQQNQCASSLHLIQINEATPQHYYICDVRNEFEQARPTLDTTTRRCLLNLFQHRRRSKLHKRTNVSLRPSYDSSTVRLCSRFLNEFMYMIDITVTCLPLFLLFVLTHLGIVYCPIHTFDHTRGTAFVVGCIFFTQALSTVRLHQHFKNTKPYMATVEILRNLESLLIYGLS